MLWGKAHVWSALGTAARFRDLIQQSASNRRNHMAKKKGGSAGTAAAVRKAKGKRGNGAQKLKQKKRR
jgi:hypothetical protein